MLPFAREQFFDLFAAYNSASWIAAVAAYPLALLAIAMAWKGTPSAGRSVQLIPFASSPAGMPARAQEMPEAAPGAEARKAGDQKRALH